MMGTKIKSSFILGACGDSLGAPIEGIFSLEDIQKKYGKGGLSKLIKYKSHFEKGKKHKAGEITDDTTMTMTTAAALIKTLQETKYPSPEFFEKLRYYSWQGYLHWAASQIDTPAPSEHIDPSVEWSKLARDFWFATGAGKGTLAALTQERPGSVEQPLEYNCEIRGKTVTSPNQGCGGMMRVAPLAFIPYAFIKHIFDAAVDNAAMTHSGQDAYVSAGMVAMFVYYASKNCPPKDILRHSIEVLMHYEDEPLFKDGVAHVLEAIETVQNIEAPLNMETMDALPAQLGYKGKKSFLAIPVLAQVTYAMLHTHTKEEIKHAMTVSANHSGDSDSVAAIVGNILGARFEETDIPKEWSRVLRQKKQIESMASELENTLQNRGITSPCA